MATLTKKQMDAFIREFVGAVDYDIAKSLDPGCAEEPESIPDEMNRYRAVIQKYLDKAK